MRLRTRIQLSTTVVLIVLLIVANTSIYFIFKNSAITSEINRLTNTSNNTVIELNKKSNLSMEQVLQAYLISNGMIRIVDQNNNPTIQVTTNKDKDYRNIPSKYDDDQFEEVIQYKDSMFVVVSIPTFNENGAIVNLQVVENVDILFGNINDLKWVFVYATVIVIIILFLTSRLLGRVITSPIQRLTQTMDLIEKDGSFEKILIMHEAKDELTEMAMTFNRMIKRLEKSYTKQEQFVSDASHELKTPLTVIDSYVKLLKRWGKDRPDILEEAIDSIASESSRMKYLTEQFLQLAKSEECIENEKNTVNIVPIVEETIHRLQQAYKHEIHLKNEQREIHMNIHEQSFVQLLIILLDNAKKYSDNQIKVELKEWKKGVSISVTDKGIGIPFEAQAHVFDRLYRVDKTRNRKTGGSGLGLSIAKRIVEHHDGDITLESVEGNGSTFTFTLPKLEV
ncbi:sensor histidine kinase [Metabacillus rhizolycopersici]|uniref:histidine kinase n=1 Tax=Metabacillus rhizolycopersici TaxID=2875709 RepID=A0ABS7UMY7_9BACI|nr:HAMP domain-containing sensor histidine kinase [Metabacillus rhizolycopersici]MBZ5749670.1 HAMP domain-containing histidine kinase [Metabacillus rhizolycopersici]